MENSERSEADRSAVEDELAQVLRVLKVSVPTNTAERILLGDLDAVA